MLLPTVITSPINQKNPLSAISILGRPSAGHNDGLSADPNGIISDDRFKKEISLLLGDGAIDQTNCIASHQALHMMQAQTSFVLPAAALTSLHVPDSDTPVLTLRGEVDTGRPFIFMNGKTLNLDQDPGLNPKGTGVQGEGPRVLGFEGSSGKPLEPMNPRFLEPFIGDRGDLSNKPGRELEPCPELEIDKKPGLSLQHGPSVKGDFRGALESCTDKTPGRIILDSNPDLNLDGSYSRLPAPSGNTTSAEAGPLRTASPEKTSFSFHEVSDVSSKGPIYLFKEDASSVRINLDGDDFGKLKLDISIRDNMVKANIVTEHPIVKEMIEINQGQLKDALSGHGLEISYLSVSVEGGQSEGLNYKEVIENSLPRKDHDRELKEEDAILGCHTLSQQDSSVNIFA